MSTQPIIAALLFLLVTLAACTPGTPSVTGYFDPAYADFPTLPLQGDDSYESHALDTVRLVSDPVSLDERATSSQLPREGGAALVHRLNEAGVWAEVMGRVSTPPLTVAGDRVASLNGSELHLFEYVDAAALEADAARLTSGARVVPATQSVVYLYRQERALLLYPGNDPVVLALLGQYLGTPVSVSR